MGGLAVSKEEFFFFFSYGAAATVPPQFTRVPFPVKALKLLLHELEPTGEAASLSAPTAPLNTQFDDGVS